MLPDDAEDALEEALEQLLEAEYIEVCGIKEDGQWLYRATQKGIDFYQSALQLGLSEIIEGMEKDVE
jgi:hypothetical protein